MSFRSTAISRALLAGLLAGAAATWPVSAAAQDEADPGPAFPLQTELQLGLASGVGEQIGERELPITEMLVENLYVELEARQPLEVILVASAIEEGKVVSVWRSQVFEVRPGVNRVPSDAFGGDAKSVTKPQFGTWNKLMPGDQLASGDRFLRGDQVPADEEFYPADLWGIVKNSLILAVTPANRRIAANSQTKPMVFLMSGKR